MKQKRQRQLICGCCGKYHMGYQSWKHDTGYGTCAPCQSEEDQREFDAMTKSINLLASSLNEQNKATLLVMSREDQESTIFKALDDGIITYTIGVR